MRYPRITQCLNLFFHSRKNDWRPSKKHFEISLQSLDEGDQSFEGEPIDAEVGKPPTKLTVNKKYRPIPLMDFADRWEKLKKDSHRELSEEYKVCFC